MTLVLQQLETNLTSIGRHIYASSYDLNPRDGTELPACEVDFVIMVSQTYPDRPRLFWANARMWVV